MVESRKRIIEIIEECQKQNTLVFLDETLLELVDNARDLTCIAEAESHDNLFIIRSFTKCFAIPGLRVGYAIGSKDVIRHMDNARLAWNLGQVEMHVAARLLDDCYGHIETAARLMAEEKPLPDRRDPEDRGRLGLEAGRVLLLQPGQRGPGLEAAQGTAAPLQRTAARLRLVRTALREVLPLRGQDA